MPRADVALPHASVKRERRRSSVVRDLVPGLGGAGASASSAASHAAIFSEVLPALKDAPLAKREALFKQKLVLCSVTGFDWDNAEADKRPKELKRLALLELVDYINTPGGQKILSEAVYQDVINMVAANIFRSLPSSAGGSGTTGSGEEVTGAGGEGGEDDDPFLEPSWPHLQLVYEFLLRFVVSQEVKVKSAKKQVDSAFCSKLLELFDSEDPRERDYLKVRKRH